MTSSPAPIARVNARTKLLEVALNVIRAKGYNATTVDELCTGAGVTKGAFFHHFVSKEALAVAAANFWSETTGEMFAGAKYHLYADPLDRVLAYIDFRAEMIDGPMETFTCLVGTMAQEAYLSSPAIRDACADSIFSHAAMLEADIDAALALRGIRHVTAASLANHTQAVLQGAFILAKASGEPERALESVAHLKRYFELLFHPTPPRQGNA